MVYFFLCALGGGCAGHQGAEEVRPIPAEPDRLMELGRAREAAGDGLRAEQYYEVALALGADASVVYPRLIAVCLAGGRLSSALVHVGHALDEAPSEDLASLRDALEVALGAHAAALENPSPRPEPREVDGAERRSEERRAP